MRELFLSNPYWGLTLTLLLFFFGQWLHQKTGKALLQPILTSSFLIILLLLFFQIPYETYQAQNQVLTFLLPLSAVILALPLYRNLAFLKKYWKSLLIAAFVGTLGSMATLFAAARLMGVDRELIATMLPKSATAAIALDLSGNIGGIISLTMVSLVIAGNAGAIFGPQFLKLLKIKDQTAMGLALGTMSHAAGTARAFGESEEAGTMASLALVLGGVFTALLAPLFMLLLV